MRAQPFIFVFFSVRSPCASRVSVVGVRKSLVSRLRRSSSVRSVPLWFYSRNPRGLIIPLRILTSESQSSQRNFRKGLQTTQGSHPRTYDELTQDSPERVGRTKNTKRASHEDVGSTHISAAHQEPPHHSQLKLRSWSALAKKNRSNRIHR